MHTIQVQSSSFVRNDLEDGFYVVNYLHDKGLEDFVYHKVDWYLMSFGMEDKDKLEVLKHLRKHVKVNSSTYFFLKHKEVGIIFFSCDFGVKRFISSKELARLSGM